MTPPAAARHHRRLGGTLDIGLSSRALKDEEKAGGLKETVFALDGIAIVVNNRNGVADLSLEQIKGLADGTITNWKDVGGADAPVVLMGREAGSGTRDGFESIVEVEGRLQVRAGAHQHRRGDRR